MNGEGANGTDTFYEPVKKDYPKLIVEKGKVFFLHKDTGEMKEEKEYVLGEERNQGNPVKIGRASPDILLDGKYRCASRKHCEIFYDAGENAYFLLDYSANGTLVNGNKVGGNRQRETRRLKHEDIIEIPAVGEKIKMTFLMRPRGMKPWIFLAGEE